MSDKRVEIEINPFKVMYRVRTRMLNKSFWYVWIVLVVIMSVLYSLSYKYSFVSISSFSLSDFLVPGITGLSFTLALITATTRIFSKEQLVSFYEYTDEDNPYKGFLFYRTIAPYIWTSTVWLVITIGALFTKLFVFNLPQILHDVLKITFASCVLIGIMSLWSLLITHIKDITLETEREINRSIQKSNDNE